MTSKIIKQKRRECRVCNGYLLYIYFGGIAPETKQNIPLLCHPSPFLYITFYYLF